MNSKMEDINFKTIKKASAELIDYVDEEITTSTTAMMNDEYLSKHFTNRLLQIALLNEGTVKVNKDPNTIIASMITASLSEDDLILLLNASLKNSPLRLQYIDKIIEEEDKAGKEKDQAEKDTDAKIVQKIENSRNQVTNSTEEMIRIVESCEGGSRVRVFFKDEPKDEIDCLVVSRPLELDVSVLDLANASNSSLQELISSYMSIDSNSSLNLVIPGDCLSNTLKEGVNAIEDSMPTVLNVIKAKAAHLDAISFKGERDGFESFFDSL